MKNNYNAASPLFRKNIIRNVFVISTFFLIITQTYGQDEPRVINLNPVIIIGNAVNKAPFVKLDINKTQIQYETVRDIGDYMRTLPNVSGIRKGGIAVDPVVRGFKFSQLNVVLDGGIRIENGCPNRMDPVASHVDAEDIDKIEIIKGPFVLRYGPSFGGVINLVTDKPHPYDTFQVHAKAQYGFESNWNGHKEHLSVSGGNKTIYFLLSGGYKNYGHYKSGDLDGHDTTFNSAFTKFNYSAKIGFSPGENQSFILSYKNICSRNVYYPALPMDETSDDTRILSIEYQVKDLTGKIKTLDVKIYQSNVEHVMDNSKRLNWENKQMVADVSAVNTGGSVEAGMRLKNNEIHAGLDVENIYKDGARTMTMQMMGTTSGKQSNLWYDAQIRNAGLFAEYNASGRKYQITAGIRCDFNSAISGDTLKIVNNEVEYFNDLNSTYLNFSASAGITRKINDWFDISLAIGRGTRSPNMLERFIKLMAVGYDNYDYLGNPQLKPETNYETDLTLTFTNENLGGIYLNAFYSYVKNYISANRVPPSVVMPQTQGVLGVKQFVNAEYVTFRGCEFSYASPEKYNLGATLVASYTYAVVPENIKYILTENQVTGETMVKNDALPEIPPFETTLSVFYKFVKGRLIPKVTLRAVADQRHTSIAFYEPDTPGFALLNCSVKYKMNKYAEVNAGVNNIFDRAYYEHLNRKIVGTSGKLYEPGRVFFANVFVTI